MPFQKQLLAALSALFATPVAAKTYVAAPAPCPAPADVIVYRIPAEAEAIDQNGWSLAGDGAIVIYDEPLRGWASRRLFARFILDPEGLERFKPAPSTAARDCAGPRRNR